MYMLYDSFLKNTIIKLDDDSIVEENHHQMEQKNQKIEINNEMSSSHS